MNQLVTAGGLGDLRTANAALARQYWNASTLPRPDSGPWQHGRITSANAEFFGSTHFSEPMTTYALGWKDPAGWDELQEFIAPSINPPAEYFEHAQFNNAEEFLSDGSNDDLRAINANFKDVDYTQSLVFRRVNNRGLRIELDYDRIKNINNWQSIYTAKLMSRLKRNQVRRAVALAIASASTSTLHWTTSPTRLPDSSLAYERSLSADASGIKPNRILIGETAWQNRIDCLGSLGTGANQFAAAAELARTVEQLGAWLGMDARLDTARYQSGTTKTRLLDNLILMFTGNAGVDMEDSSNFKLAWTACANGTRWAVYVRQLSVKKWEIVVEHYELLFCPSVLGVLALTASNS